MTTSCSGEWEAPGPDGTIEYKALWSFNEGSGKITFTLLATLASDEQQWLAIGMNSQPRMV